jgi:hypothetical protein
MIVKRSKRKTAWQRWILPGLIAAALLAGTAAGQSPARHRFEPSQIHLYHADQQVDRLCLDLGPLPLPEVFALEGARPRLVIDIHRVSAWDNTLMLPHRGNWIRQIRSHRDDSTGTLRIVLDLTPDADFDVRQSTDPAEAVFCLIISGQAGGG